MNENKKTEMKLSIELDGPTAAPEHHKVIFENDRVRVVDFRVPPGETVPLHTHRWATVNYVITLSDFRTFDSEGNVKTDSRDGNAPREGSAFYQYPFPALHSVENIGDGEMRGIAVELKD